MSSSRASPSENATALLEKVNDAELDQLCLRLDLPTEQVPRSERATRALAIWKLAKAKGDTTLALLEEELCVQLGQPPPNYYYYLSCAEADRDDPLCVKFFEDLTARLRALLAATGQPPSGDLRFFDERNAEDSEAWSPWSLRAMQRCRALVCLYGRAYFQDPHCGRVWNAFSDRLKLYRQGRGGVARRPQLILPVLWKPFSELLKVLPKVARDVEPVPLEAPYDKEGLRALLQLASADRDTSRQTYDNFVDAVARHVIAAEQAESLPESLTVQPLNKIPSAFYVSFEAAAAEEEKGTDYAKFIVVAATKSDIEALRGSDAYDDAPELWRPYQPISSERLGIIITQEAGEAKKISSFIPLDADLQKNLRLVDAGRNIILIVIDPWTLLLKNYGDYLKPHHQELLERSTVIVCWNDEDSETKSQRQGLLSGLENVFPAKLRSRYLDRFRNEVPSVSRLRKELQDALVVGRSAIVNEAEEPKTAQGLAFDRPRIIAVSSTKERAPLEAVRRAEEDGGIAIHQPRIEGPSGGTQI